MASVAMILLRLIEPKKINLRLAPVASPLNIADLPTQGGISAIEDWNSANFPRFEEDFRFFAQLSPLNIFD